MLIETKLKKRVSPVSTYVRDAGEGQAYIVASLLSPADAVESASELYARIADELAARRLEIVHERVFGNLEAEQTVKNVRKIIFHKYGIPCDTPVTYVQGDPPWGEGLAGVIIRAVASGENRNHVRTINDNDIPVGRVWRRKGSRFLILQNIQGIRDDSSLLNTKPLQTQRMIEHANRILCEHGASYKDVFRTWIYLSHINEWYREFNHARNYTYDRLGITPSSDDSCLLPASTGIEGRSRSGAACTMDLIALISPPLTGGDQGEGEIQSAYSDSLSSKSKPFIKRLSNPHQIEAFHYYSAFSRGVLINESDISSIQVSGTAAIDEHGASLYPGDVRRQIACTLEKIGALIGQEGADLNDICAATVFVKRPEYAAIFREIARDRGLEDLPAVCVVADICREELLFEIDAEVEFNYQVQGAEGLRSRAKREPGKRHEDSDG